MTYNNNSFGLTGLTVNTYADLLGYYTTAYQTIYGADINLSSSTADGQNINILVQGTLDVQDLIVSVNANFDPDQATGVWLDQRCAINGIQRIAGTYSQVYVVMVTTAVISLVGLDVNTTNPYTISDNTGNQWYLAVSQSNLAAGSYTFLFQSATPGAVPAVANTINIPVTIILGVASVNNPSGQSVLGVNEESDAALRVRRQQSVSQTSQGYLAGLYAALGNIPGIIASVYENDMNGTDSEGVPGHSIWVLIFGTPSVPVADAWDASINYSYGQIASVSGVNYISWINNNLNNLPPNPTYWGVYNPIAMAIYYKRNAGCGMFGAQSYEVTQIDGNIFTIYWDNVIDQNFFTFFVANSINGITPPNLSLILSQLPSLLQPLPNASVNITTLGSDVQSIDTNTYISDAGFSNGFSQTILLSAVPVSGTVDLLYGVNKTPTSINYDDSNATIQTKVNAVTGLGTAIVTGTLLTQSVQIVIPGIVSATTLITPINSSLGVTFTFDEAEVNQLSPTSRKYRLFTQSSQMIVTVPADTNGNTIQLIPSMFSTTTNTATILYAYGGYYNDALGVSGNVASYTYAFVQNQSGGTLGGGAGPVQPFPSTSVNYVSGNSAGVDIISVTDALGNTGMTTVSVV